MKDSLTKTICFFNTNKAWGGGEKWHFTTAKEFQRRGYNVYLVTHVHSQLRTKGTTERLQTYSFNIGNLTFLNPLKILVLMMFFRAKKIDTIIMNLPADLKSAGIAAKLAGVKKIIYRRGMPHPLRNTWLNRFLFTNILTDVVVNSEEIGRSLVLGNEAWFPKAKIRLVYNGINLAEARPDGKKEFSGQWIIGNAGRLTHQKGQEHLLELAQQLKADGINFQLLIAGEGELRAELQQSIQAKNLNDCVKLLGHVTDMPAFLNSLDIFVFPSLFEGSANTLIETLHHGIPTVAFDVSSNPEIIINGKTGLLAKAFESQDLVRCVKEIMNSPLLRKEFKKNGDELVRERFDSQKNLKILEAII